MDGRVIDPDSNSSVLNRWEPAHRELELKPSTPGVVDQLFGKMSQLDHCVFLDSSINTQSATGQSLGRYSFLAAEPIEWIEMTNDCHQPFAQLRERTAHYNTVHLSALPPFQGGLAGLFSFDINRCLEKINPPKIDEFQIPLIAAGIYDVVVAIDHDADRIHIISQGWPEQTSKSRQQLANNRLKYFTDLLMSSDQATEHPATASPSPIVPEMAFPIDGPPGLYSNFTEPDYLQAVQRCIDYIFRGDLFQVNLAQRLLCEAKISSRDLHQRMRRVNPAPFATYFDLNTAQIISASPERFLKVKNNRVETRPIKGTRPRTRFPEVDLPVGHQLTESEKDRSENIMIVDLMRNDLARVCQADSVHLTQCCELESYQSVLHLVSAVEGELKPECDVFDLLEASFPGGSITGAPKIRAMEIIQELEPTARGAYCGSLGYIDTNGNMDLNILIRTITAKDGWWQIPVGGGIVSQSNPKDEYRETWTKAAGMLKALGL